MCAQLSLREMARITGFGSNHMRAQKLFEAKKSANNIKELLADNAVAGIFEPRKDKLSGDPIWTEA